MKVLFLLIGLLMSLQYAYALQLNLASKDTLEYTSETFQFTDAQGKQVLEGTLTIPEKFTSSTKLVVLVAPPLPIPRDYYGLFATLADILSKNGCATFRFDNRAYTDKSLSEEDEAVTMFDQADDIHEAIKALRRDKRFVYHPIGLLGHSEGGNAVAIETSRNKDVNFVICLSTCGIKGIDFAYEQTSVPILFNRKMPDDVREFILKSLKSYLHIVNEYNSLDSIKNNLKQELTNQYNLVNDKSRIYGKASLDEICQKVIWGYTRPRLIAFTKYDPDLYFSKLSCPTLIMCGKMDGNIDCEKHLDGLKTILEKNGKQNYEILAIDSVNHGYIKAKELVPLFIERISSQRSAKASNVKYAIDSFEYIARWIAEQ